MGMSVEIPLSVVRPADVMFGILNPAIDTLAIGQCIKKDRSGVVTGKCPIADLAELSTIPWAQRATLCLGCNNPKLNGIENDLLPSRLDYGSTSSLKAAVSRDMAGKPSEPSDVEVRELIAILQPRT